VGTTAQNTPTGKSRLSSFWENAQSAWLVCSGLRSAAESHMQLPPLDMRNLPRSGQCCSKIGYFAHRPPVRRMDLIYQSVFPLGFTAQT
jgi:hypothetical protein